MTNLQQRHVTAGVTCRALDFEVVDDYAEGNSPTVLWIQSLQPHPTQVADPYTQLGRGMHLFRYLRISKQA